MTINERLMRLVQSGRPTGVRPVIDANGNSWWVAEAEIRVPGEIWPRIIRGHGRTPDEAVDQVEVALREAVLA